MSKKIERVFREHRLSAEEVARDEEVRRKVRSEFPPAAQSGSASGRLSQALMLDCIKDRTDYDRLRQTFRWDCPEFFNFGNDVVDERAAATPYRLALWWVGPGPQPRG